jgi:hypothetical protein
MHLLTRLLTSDLVLQRFGSEYVNLFDDAYRLDKDPRMPTTRSDSKKLLAFVPASCLALIIITRPRRLTSCPIKCKIRVNLAKPSTNEDANVWD